MKLRLTNHAGVNLSLSNEFDPHLERELEDETTQEGRFKCIKKYSKFKRNWKLEYESHTKEVYMYEDNLHNVSYLIVRFE